MEMSVDEINAFLVLNRRILKYTSSLPLNLRQHHKYQYHKKGNLTVKIKTTN